MIFAAIDFETFYDKECSVTELGAEAYTRHPRYYAYLVAIKVGNREWCGDPKDPECPWHLIDGIPWVAHNAQFDYWVWKRLFESGDVTVAPSQWFDTTAIPAYMQVGRDLANAAWVLLGKEVSKDIRNKAKSKHWKDFDSTMQQLMIEYAMNDTRLCYELFEKHRSDVPDEEWALSEMTMFQGIHGVQIDTGLLESHLKTVAEKQTELISQIPWKDNLKVAILSVGALRRQCESAGVKDMPSCTNKDSAEWSEWVKRVDLPFVEAFQQLRSLKKFLALLHKIKARVSPEGRLHFSLKYCGSRLTGRWAGDAGINMQNLPKGEMFGVNIRNLFIASPGHKLLNSDMSNIEPRALAFLTKDMEFLKLVADGVDIYEASVRATGHYTDPRPLKEVDPGLRQMSKVKTLGLGYGAGDKRFREFAGGFGIELTEKEAHSEVQTWRAQNWRIVNFWCHLQKNLEKSRGAVMKITLPSGRVLKYRDIRKVVPKPGARAGFVAVLEQTKHPKSTRVWGSLLTENVVQAYARDLFASAMVRMRDRGVRILWSVHDEIIAEAPEGEVEDTKKIIEEEFRRSPDPVLTLDCETTVSDFYDK